MYRKILYANSMQEIVSDKIIYSITKNFLISLFFYRLFEKPNWLLPICNNAMIELEIKYAVLE